jgi:hypothetical protein
MSRKKPTKKQALEKELLELWKMACLKRYGDNCIFCGRHDQTTFHHYIPKSRSLLLRFDTENGVPMCNMREHSKIHHYGTPDEVWELCEHIRKVRGKKWCDYINKQKSCTQKSTLTFLEEQKKKLLTELKN